MVFANDAGFCLNLRTLSLPKGGGHNLLRALAMAAGHGYYPLLCSGSPATLRNNWNLSWLPDRGDLDTCSSLSLASPLAMGPTHYSTCCLHHSVLTETGDICRHQLLSSRD